MTDRQTFLLGPCGACPFRTDEGAVRLRRGRKEGIAHWLRFGEVFHCHKTVKVDDDDRLTGKAMVCGGALVLMHKEGVPNGAKQVAERLGLLDPAELDVEAPVYGSLQEWIASNSI